MRALNKGWIGIVLIILFGASLFFFRGSSRYSNLFNSDNFVANISGTHISTTQFLRSLEMNIGQFAQMIGEELTGDQIRAFQIHQLVMQNLVNNAIFENEFDSLNYILDDSIVAKKTKERFPNLYENNRINDDALNSFLRQQRLKIEDLVNIINYETRAVVFDNLIFKKNYPSEFSNKINMFNNQTRNIELLKVPYDQINIPDLIESSIVKNDPDLINYFEENKLNYMTQEIRDISYLVIDKDFFKNDFIPDENEISNYFNQNRQIYNIPEKRSFKQFNFKTKEEAEKFKLEITGLSDNEIISYSSNNKIKFNNFEDVSRNQVLEELSNVIFSLNNNEISNVVTTTLAHHLIILNKITPKKEPQLNEVKEIIKNTLTDVKLNNFFNDFKSRVNQQILDGFTISEIAAENNLRIENINNAIRNSEEDNFERTVINSAFSQNKDFVSDIIDFDINKSFIINVNEIYPSKVETIENVFKKLVSDFVKFKKINFSNELFEKAKLDNNLIKINNVFGLNIKEMEVKLNSNNLPASMIRNIFDINLNEIAFSSDENNVYFVKVKKIQIPEKNESLQEIDIITELKNAFGNEIMKTKNISLNDELINGLLSQYK